MGKKKTAFSTPAEQRKYRRRQTKRLTVCAMLCALGAMILYLGALIEVLDLCTAALASLLTVLVMIEYGGTYPWGVYIATSLLSLLLLPNKNAAAVYVLFGYYPIVKAYLERLRPVLCRLSKQLIFFVTVLAALAAANALTASSEVLPPWMNVAIALLGYLTLNIFDFALTRLITLYVVRYRARVSRWMN